MNDRINVVTSKKYAYLECKQTGIIIKYADEAVKGKICFKLTHQIKFIRLPSRIYDMYDMENASVQMQKEEILIFARKLTNEKVKPLVFTGEIPDISEEDVIKSKTKNMHFSKISLSKDWRGEEVTVHLSKGKKKRVILKRGEKKGISPISNLREEFGTYLYFYPYDTAVYTTKISETAATLTVPTMFLRDWGIGERDAVKYLELRDGSICITPLDKTDAFTGKTLDCAKDSVETLTACEDCSNDTDIKELILLMKDTLNLCKEIKNERLDLRNRVEALEEKMKTA